MADTNEASAAGSDTPLVGRQKIYTIGGVKINFPCEAYPSQISIMDKIVRGIQKTQNCLLESPTGSGKTLALLCGALAWQKQDREIKEKERIQEAVLALIAETNENENEEASSTTETECCKNLPLRLKAVKTEPRCEDEGDLALQWEEVDTDFVLGNIGAKRRAETIYKFKTEKKQSLDDSSAICSHNYNSISASPTKTIDLISDNESENNELVKLKEKKSEKTNDLLNLKNNPLGLTNLDVPDSNATIPAPQARVPKIFFGTRTHKQIAQVVKELSRTEYKNVRMCILSSREHTCIMSSKTFRSKNELCHTLLDPHKGTGCLFNINVNRMGTHHALAKLGLTETHDIEDLVKLGKKVNACPYFASRSLMTTADIVFCPYNYLIDPLVRNSLNINLNGAIVVFDEAHNVEDISRNAASGSFSCVTIAEAVKDCKSMIPIPYMAAEHHCLAGFLTRFADWIQQAATSGQPDIMYSGIELAANFETVDIGPASFETCKHSFMDVLADLKEKDPESDKPKVTISAATKNLLEQLILVFSYLYKDNLKESYHGQITRQLEKSDQKLGTPKGSWMSARNNEQNLQWNYVLNIWCLDPSVVFKELTVARSIILSSGTLAPMYTFESELGVQFMNKLEANHVIHPSQVFVSTVYRGPTNQSLNGKYTNAMTFGFQEELGRLIINVCKTVPHGVLCFLPSYTLMDKLEDRWTNIGILDEIKKYKFVYFEPRNNTQLTSMMEDYYENIIATEKGLETDDGCLTGCLLLGICRGKISEGIDFTDNDARAVITVGIPFPNITDKQVLKKKEYNSKHAAIKGLLTGDRWYHCQAFRALNQALGRCIRHRKDWGAIILVDERFGQKSNTEGLSKWVKQQVHPFNSWNSFHSSLQFFIKTRTSLEQKTVT